MTALAATARYELRMQLRKPTIWIATGLPFALWALFAVLGSDNTGLQRHLDETSPKVWVVEALGWFTPVLPMVFGIVLADRLVRDRKLGVAELLDVTPTNRRARLVGKYLGACAATAVPVAVVYLAVAVAFIIWRERPAALWWGLASFAVIVLPLLLLAGSLSFLGPQLMPTPLFRVLIVGLWFWAGATEVESQFPSFAGAASTLRPLAGWRRIPLETPQGKVTAMQQPAYPVRLTVDYPDRPLDRLTSGFRIFVAIPILFVLGAVSGGSWDWSYDDTRTAAAGAGGLLFLGPLLLILFRRKYPRWWFDWNLELQRFGNRVAAYLALMDDRYPSTDQHQSVHLDYPYPDAQRDLNRWLPLVKWLLAIPHYVVLFLLDIAALVVVIVAWFAILFTGRYPRGMFDFVEGVIRWHNRVVAYAWVLVTDRYPPFRLTQQDHGANPRGRPLVAGGGPGRVPHVAAADRQRRSRTTWPRASGGKPAAPLAGSTLQLET